MTASSDDDVEEYLDDPISLVAFENIKTEKCDWDQDYIIDLGESTDEESKCTSSYGKRNFVLPVTFFDISRNVRLLNECKPMSIRIVDCKQSPSYYTKYISEKCRNQPEDSSIEVIKSDNDNENEPNNAIMKYAGNDSIQENTHKTQEKVKKRSPRRDTYYEKLKKRKERRKETALKCKDLSTVDFKRNKGLVGLKITGNIFKKIVDTERALSIVKSISGEKKSKDNSGSDREKILNDIDTNLPESEYTEDCKTNTKATITTNGNLPDDTFKEQTKNDKLTTCITMNGDLGCTDNKCKKKNETNINSSITETTSNSSNDKCKSSKTDTHKIKSLTKNNISNNKHKEKSEIINKNTIVETCGKISDDKSKNSEQTNTEKEYFGTESRFLGIKSRVKGPTSTNRITIGTKNNFCEDKSKKNDKFNTKKPDIYSCKEESKKNTLTATTKNTAIDNIYMGKVKNNTYLPLRKTKSHVPKLDENCKGNTYLKQIGTALDNLGTSIMPIEDGNTNNHVPKNINIDYNINGYKNRVKVDDGAATDISKSDNNNGNNKMRCSLKISCKKIIEKALKLKQTKYNETPPDMSNTVVEQHATDIMKNDDQTIQKVNLKRSRYDVESFYLVPSKNKKHCNSKKSMSSKSRQVETSTAKDAKVSDQAGSNSPVIPCTTITFRAAQPKLSPFMPIANNLSQTQKRSTGTLSTSLTNNHQETHIHEVTSNNIQTNPLLVKPSHVFLTNQARLSKNPNDLASSNNSVTRSNIPANYNEKNSSVNSTVKVARRKYPHIFIRMEDSKNSGLGPIITENRLLDRTISHPPVNGNPVMPMTKSSSTGNVTPASNHTTNKVIQNQTNPNSKVTSLPSFIRSLNSSHSGNNAIILRRPPPSCHLQKNMSPIRGQPIQTVVNHRFQNQTFPFGGGPTRFQAYPLYIPPNTNMLSNASPAPPTTQHIHPSRMPPASSSHIRGVEMGLRFWQSQFPEYPFPIDLRPPPPPPKPVLSITSVSSPTPAPPPAPKPAPPPLLAPSIMPPSQNSFNTNLESASVSEISKDSVIGSTPNGELIKKINIAMPSKIVSDKGMMLAELNNAVMAPELINDPEDKEITLRKLEESNETETAEPKYSKPCPLSKKIKDAHNEIPEKLSQNVAYSPPILPILTYEEILSQSDKYKTAASKSVTHTTANMGDNTPQKIKIPFATSGKQYKAKKISFQDYRKRLSKDVVDRIDVRKIRKPKNVADDYNQDQGYDSDSTVKL